LMHSFLATSNPANKLAKEVVNLPPKTAGQRKDL